MCMDGGTLVVETLAPATDSIYGFMLKEEHLMLQKMVRDFADKEVAPKAAEIDETCRFPIETFEKLAAMELLGLPISSQYGGGGADTVSAGAGNDLIRMADLSFTRVDGGRGTDTGRGCGTGRSRDLPHRGRAADRGGSQRRECGIEVGAGAHPVPGQRLGATRRADPTAELFVVGERTHDLGEGLRIACGDHHAGAIELFRDPTDR